MNKVDKINTFFSSQSFAITGVSRDERKFGRMVYDAFVKQGKKVIPVNPNVDSFNEIKVYPSVNDLPAEVDAIVILNNRDKSQAIIDQAVSKGIRNIWIQQKSEPAGYKPDLAGAEYNIITNECVFMWSEPVTGVHKFHRFLKRLFSKN